jgi:hypothetical protein
VDGVEYAVPSARIFAAGVAGDVKVVSAGTLCGPAGSVCTVSQLIAGAQHGFFAEVAIDQAGILRSVIESDSAGSPPTTGLGFGPVSPSPTPTRPGPPIPATSAPAATASATP